jgi:hypothetical protein
MGSTPPIRTLRRALRSTVAMPHRRSSLSHLKGSEVGGEGAGVEEEVNLTPDMGTSLKRHWLLFGGGEEGGLRSTVAMPQ